MSTASCPHASSGPSCEYAAASSSSTAEESLSSPSTLRIASSIRRTGTDSTWTYPSMEMFRAAVEKKQAASEESKSLVRNSPETLASLVHLHNIVNEQVWQEILKYERMHCECREGVSLKTFQGKSSELSIKARLYSLLGYTKPFDRHDWTVDRCGQSVRYIIDFYNGPPKTLSGIAVSIPSVFLDVRPAPTMSGILDRLKMAISVFSL